ncbi:hypothetical protein SPFL3102_00397 [Sporomusaceae bacterium FL31]|nr:hypothetical protein SPFL3101_01889 [Sporomusaceae bacterium FL31]GCE32608.1 hypothetical protein SPFL3102_00397 [Sporomusaceae bacterium]
MNHLTSGSTEIASIVEVTRESSFVGCLFSFKVLVDDQVIGQLKNGEKKRFELSSGLHEIQIKVNWSLFSSPKESFLLKDFVKFTCKPKVGVIGLAFKLPFYALFKRSKFIKLMQG